jgi:alanyl-tRNA synthetase
MDEQQHDLETGHHERCRITSMTVPGNPYRHHTHRLDLEDPSIREWAATVLLADPDQGIVLDRSAFYPGGGGQPPDYGVLLVGECPDSDRWHAQG